MTPTGALRPRSWCSAQHGLTLVELMISIAIGLILITGMVQILASSKMTYLANEGLTRIQENGRLSIDLLTRHIRMTGYRNDPRYDETRSFVDFGGVQPLSGTDGGGLVSDSITIRYYSDADCTGTILGASPDVIAGLNGAAVTTNTYNLQTETDRRSALYCNDIELVDGVENMQILYGLDTDANGSVNTFLRADELSAATWPAVVSVRLALLVATDEELTSSYDTNQRNMLDITLAAAGDRRIRHVFSTTINLRNR